MAGNSHEYVVVARRYRPQTFDELIGQEHIARGLKNAISAERVGHAYLFTGARGVGKTSAARILAKALNCRQGPAPTPCNQCDVCESIAAGDDVDVLEIDGASNRGIDEMRQLRQNVAVRPTRVRFKVYIIDEVHMLTREAFNALLKTLEEPPPHVKFIFATTEPQKVPITILSRCQRFDFSGIATTAIERRLAQISEQEGVTAESEALALIARRAAGSMRDSQSLLEQLLAVADGVISAADVDELLGTAPAVRVGEFAERLHARDAGGALALLAEAVEQGTDIGQFWEQLTGLFRDVMVASVGAGTDQFRHALPSQESQVVKLAEGCSIHEILAVMQVLETTAVRMRSSIDPRTLAEMATVRICHLPDLQLLSDAIEGLRDAGGSKPSVAAPRSDSKKNLLHTTEPSLSESRESSAQHRSPPAQGLSTESIGGGQSGALEVRSDAAAEEIWKQACGGIDGMLAEYLARAERITSEEEGKLIAWYPAKYAIFKDFCEQPEHRKRIEEGLACVAQRPLLTDFRLIPESQTPPPTMRKSRRERLRDVSKRPFVQKALDLFADEANEFRYVAPERRD